MAIFHFSWHLPLILTAGLFVNNALATDSSEQQGLCPSLGWSEGLGAVAAASQIATAEPNSDCSFHQWSWEVFIWATAPDPSGNPRFLSLATPADLLGTNLANKTKKPILTLGTRTHLTDTLQETGAIVQADGNMLIGKNGYPVYASVHMDNSYLDTAKQNLVYNGGYSNNVQNEVKDFTNPNYYFQSGAAAFKATWLRLGDGVNAPTGSYTTAALVPILTVKNNIVQPKIDDQGNVVTTKVNVALVGLHVVGRTDGHPEFVWATFEHKANAPMVADRQFKFDNTVDGNDYTFYKANTPFSQVNLPNTAPSTATKQTPVLSFNEKTQKFSPVSNAVQENKTGGESNPGGQANIASVNQSSHTWLKGQPKQAIFANYNLIGTVWKQANSYSPNNKNWPNIDQKNSIGSVLLANTTAETYRQTPNHQTAGGAVDNNLHNCFSCHNPQSYSFTGQFPPRLIGISHILDVKSPTYETPNQMPLCWNVSAGPIWSNGDAQQKCPTACASTKWNGQWTTTQIGVESVCGCCNL